LNLVLQTAHHIALALHHCIETVIGDLGGVPFRRSRPQYPSSPPGGRTPSRSRTASDR
jgi:hypothetical protein